MDPCQLTTIVNALANVLSCRLSEDELSLTAAILTQLGDTLATIALQRSLCCGTSSPQQTGSENG